MKILITQRELMQFGGSELVAIELARALSARGHAVSVYCPGQIDLARLLKPSGVSVSQNLRDLPWAPDVIHGQHHLPAMAAFAHFPETTGVYCWHGVRPWVEQAPPLARIAKYVVNCGWMAPMLEVELGLPPDRIETVPNFVDPRRFSQVRKAPERPRRALLYGLGGFSADELGRLHRSCDANGLTLDKVGYPYGNPHPAPEVLLPQYDVVFAIGRCAIEALACGCAVIPIVPGLAGGLVTAASLDEWAFSNFSPRHFTSADQVSDGWLAAQLQVYSACDQAALTEQLRDSHSLDRATVAFEALYSAATVSSPASTQAEFAPYLERLAPHVDKMWGSLEELVAIRRQSAEAHARLDQLGDLNAHLRTRGARLEAELLASDRLVRQLAWYAANLRGLPATPDGSIEEIAMLVRASGAFDPTWYLETYRDVAEAGVDPVVHYILYGVREGRAPLPGLAELQIARAAPPPD